MFEGEENTQENEEQTTESATETEATEQTTEQPGEVEQEKDSKKIPAWAQARMDELAFEGREEKRKRLAAERRAEELLTRIQNPTEEPKEPEVLTSQAQIEKLAEQKAAQMLRDSQFNDRCNSVYEAGKEEYSDFDDALGTFSRLGGVSRDLLEVVVELPDSHKVIHHLGSNPEDAQRVLKLSPTKMAIELTKISQNLGKEKKPVSAAHKPVRPVDGRSSANKDLHEIESTSEWMKKREAQLAAKRKR